MSAMKTALSGVGTVLSKVLPDFDAVRTETGIDFAASAEANKRAAESFKKSAASSAEDAVEYIAVGTITLPVFGLGILPIIWGVTNAVGAGVEKLIEAKDEADAHAYAAMAGRDALKA